MKLVKEVLTNRVVILTLLGCLLLVFGVHFWAERQKKRFEESLPKLPASIQEAQADLPTAQPDTGNTTQAGYFHRAPPPGASATPKSQQEQIAIDMGLLSEEEIASQEKARLAFYESFGLQPPPPGYRYAKIGDGDAQLVKYKDPIIQVAWGEGYGNYHQLTDDELARYSCLRAIDNPLVIKLYNLSPEEVELGLAWKRELYEKTNGPRPTITAAVSRRASDPMTPEDERALIQRMDDVAADLLPPSPESFRIDYNVFDQLIAEIRATLERR